MDTYLNAPNLPFLLHFPTTDASTVAAAASDWVSRGQIFTVALTNDPDPAQNRYLLINFGAVSCLTVHGREMFDGIADRAGAAVYTAFVTDSGSLEIETRSLLAYPRGMQHNPPPG